ncbi:MAG: hypothetical protein ACLGHP_10160, partial [Vicinamibacteria bacterium]
VARRLRAAQPGQLRIVVTHHPLHVTREKDLENLLHGHEDAARAWAAAGAAREVRATPSRNRRIARMGRTPSV